MYLVSASVPRRVAHAEAALVLAERAGHPLALGRSLSTLCRTYARASRPTQAIAAGQAAVDVLHGRDRAEAQVLLAHALFLGRRPAEALTVVERAVASYRELLDAAEPGLRRRVLTVDLGIALSQMGLSLGNLGRGTSALAALREAMACLKQLVPGRLVRIVYQDLFIGPVLARLLVQSGDHEEAIAVATRTVDLAGLPARLQPSIWRPTVAAALAVLAHAQMSAEDFASSVGTAGRALTVYRMLDSHETELAWVLNVLAHGAERLGRIGDAQVALDEGVAIYARLAVEDVSHRAEHARLVAAKFDFLVRQEQDDQARDLAVHVAPHLRDYPPTEPVRHLFWEAAAALNRAGHPTEALRFIDDAVRLAVALDNRKGHVSGLLLRARILEKSGDLKRAIETIGQAVEASPSRASVDPMAADDTDVLLLCYRAELQLKGGDIDQAEASAREAVAVGRAIEDSYRLDMGLAILASVLSRRHHHEEAARLRAECADLRRPEATRDVTSAPRLLHVLRGRIHDLVATWRAEQALTDVEEAIDLSRRLRGEWDEELGIDELARSLRVAARAYAAADHLAEAIDALRELADLARTHPTYLRSDLAKDAFATALHEAPQTLATAWTTLTGQPYPD